MKVFDILPQVKEAIGNCTDAVAFRRLTDASRLLSNKNLYDPQLAVIDLCVYNGCVTLPYEVGTVLAVNVDDGPTLIQDQWFQYHINGPGQHYGDHVPYKYSYELGEFSTYRDPSIPVKLVATLEAVQDNNVSLRVYGWDVDGKRIYSTDGDGNTIDGFLVPTLFGFQNPNATASPIARIDRVEKAVSKGYIRLTAIDPTTLASLTEIGYYRPEETLPRYRRIRVPDRSTVSVKYKKRDAEIRSSNDWINLDNREALILAVKAVDYRAKNQFELARSAEGEAQRILSEEVESRRPKTTQNAPQIIYDDFPVGNTDRLFY